jgi:hypothetical protein
MDTNITKRLTELISLVSLEVKKKRTLSGLDQGMVDKEISLFFRRNPKILAELSPKEDKEIIRLTIFKQVVKEVRKNLNKSYGSFQSLSISKRNDLLEELKNSTDKMDEALHKELLSLNASARERIEMYPDLYAEVFELTDDPESILDLGAGMNPLSYPWMHLDKVNYTATEINTDDTTFLNEYFKIMESEGLKGKALILDLSDEAALTKLKELSKVDVTLLFKLLESIELTKKRKYKIIEQIITSIRSKWLVVSFATKTLSQRSMVFTERKWFEAMIQRLGKPFTKIEKSNEVFYVIENK